MRHYCTYFDSNYLLQGLALYHSLDQHIHDPFTLWVLCLDEPGYQILQKMSLPKIRLIALDQFEGGDTALLKAKQNRSRVEYYWTCTPSLPLYVFEHNPQIDLIIYLDADLYFFSDPAPIFEELGKGSILIVKHRFPPGLLDKERFGIYNVGLVGFRRDQNGLACLTWWRDRCNEWCYQRLEDGRYGDQKYLDDWPTRFKDVVVLKHKGAGLAPWNLAAYTTSFRSDQVFVDEDLLIFYHFHRFKMVTNRIFVHGMEPYSRSLGENILNYQHVRYLYSPYAKTMRRMGQKLRQRHFDYSTSHRNSSLKQLVRGLSKGRYLLADDSVVGRSMTLIGLWRGQSDLLAQQGFQLCHEGNR
jgi:hypothetical protein